MPYRYEGTVLADLLWRASRLKSADFKEVLFCLFTLKEIEEAEQRWHILQRLTKGISYRVIADELDISKTTVAKIAQTFQGSHESFKDLLPED